MSNLAQRILTAMIGGGIMIGAILWNEYSFSALFLIIAIMSMWEFYSLCEGGNLQPQKFLGLGIGVLLYLFFSYFLVFLPVRISVLTLPLIACVFIRELYTASEKPFVNIAITLLGVLYLALPLALMNLISQGIETQHQGTFHPRIVLGYLFLVWASDTGAFFAGRKFGRRKLFERISPKKTWEGSMGGTALALIVAFILSVYFTDLRLADWLALSIIVVVTGTLGDLVESMFKRSIQIKDSGSILPGHGGFLDRFDAFFISAPFVFAYLQLAG